MFEFTLFNIKIQIKFLFIAIITIFLLTDTSNMAIICLVSCILHEMGHIISFFIFKIKPNLLVFDITGIKLEQPNSQLDFLTEFFILISGSLTNFIIAFIFNLINPTTTFYFSIIYINITIGCFNLLPIASFDGGKIVFAILSHFLSDNLSYKISFAIDRFTNVFLICLCFVSIFAYELNLSYIIMTILLITSLIINELPKRYV